MALTLNDLRPEPGERSVFLGMTGSGKTTLAARLLRPLPYVVAIDPKGMLGADKQKGQTHLPGFRLIRDPNKLPDQDHSHLQYRPGPEFQTEEWWDTVFWWLYNRKHTTAYVDDLNLVLKGREAPDGYRACVTCGRERGVGIWTATQRPAGVPQIALTESERIFAFILKNDNDRKACVNAGLDQCIRDKPILVPYWFYYARTGALGTHKLRMNLGKGRALNVGR